EATVALRRVAPRAGHLLQPAQRIQRAEVAEELPRLVLLAGDDLVGVAPPHLERHARVRDLVDPARRAALPVGALVRRRRTADLDPCERLQGRALAAEQGEVGVAAEEVRD